MSHVRVPELGRSLEVRPGTSDEQVLSDTFAGRYHLPPDSMPSPRTVLDVGANIGATAAHYCALWPSALVVAVEMDADSLELGRANAPKAAWLQAAVAGHAGVGTYDPSAPADARKLGPGPAEVTCLTLAQAVRGAFPGGCDFVKLDIEGGEWDVLADATWAVFVRNMLVELHAPAPTSLDDAPLLEGRDGPSPLLGPAVVLLERLGYAAGSHVVHPHAVFACR